MEALTKRILSDESGHPVEVRIAYDEWLRLEKALEKIDALDAHAQMTSVFGTVNWGEDGLEYQKRLRAEWD